MQVSTFSVVVGTRRCNADCPYCVARLTPHKGVDVDGAINWGRFDVACRLAENAGVSTMLLTGKGEPTLYPEQITGYVVRSRRRFPLVELQTNGLRLGMEYDGMRGDLNAWRALGLTTVSLSIVDCDPRKNAMLLVGKDDGKRRVDIEGLTDRLHGDGLSVRWSCLMIAGYVDSTEAVARLIERARAMGVEQLTLRQMYEPSGAAKVHAREARWIRENALRSGQLQEIVEYVGRHPKLLTLLHGAEVYDVDGQNVCLTDCGIEPLPTPGLVRDLIFFPDGHVRYNWKYEGAILV